MQTKTGIKRPTIKDVAERAGVSVSTVSYVLNNSGPVASDRRNRVLDVVRALEYLPNDSARRLKRRSASVIGVIVPELSNTFFAMVVEGVQRAAFARGVLMVLVIPDDEEQSDERQGQLMRSQRIDGVLYLSGTGSMPGSVYELTRSGPVVLIDERIPGLKLPALVCDSRRGAREVATHVLDQGHRRIAVIGGPSALWTAQQRLAGYREAFAGAGLDPDSVPVFEGDYRQGSGKALAAAALSSDARPTALICANDLMAIGAMEYCREAGLPCPDYVSIVGFDDLPLTSMLTPGLTTVRQPAHELGFGAVTMLLDILNGVEPGPVAVLPVDVQLRNSVSSPRHVL
jgi:DNA-binding LacI/PurR family transcriptional regulator